MQMLSLIVVLTILATLAVGLWVVSAETTFIGSTVLKVDQTAGQLTVRTTTGKVWSLPVADPALLSGLKEGDRVSFEIDTTDRIVNLVRVSSTEGQAPATERGG